MPTNFSFSFALCILSCFYFVMFFLLICEMRKVDFSFLLLQCAASCRWPTTISGRWLTAHSSAAQRSSGLLGLLTDICSWNTFLTSSFYKAGVWGRITHTVLCVLRHVLFILFQQTNPQGSCCCPGLPRPHTQQALRLFACRQRVWIHSQLKDIRHLCLIWQTARWDDYFTVFIVHK